MRQHVGDRAVVLGGGIGGLLAARVLAERFAEVVVVDRDRLTGTTGARRGVPHGRHAHGLVARGQQILEGLFPGLTDGMRDAGAIPGDFNGDIRWYFNGRRLRPGRSGLISVPATRPLLEAHIRNRVQAIENVRFLDEHTVHDLCTTGGDARVTGVVMQAENSVERVTVDADLVVDSTGRGSRTPAWLQQWGYARPEEERVRIGLAYTTRHFRLDHDPFGSDLAIIPAATPQHPRGGFLYRLPGVPGGVELSLTGMLGEHPPTDPDGFLTFARSLPEPSIYAAVRDAEPLDDAVMFTFPASVRRHYERLTAFPAGLLVMGDAVCSFNPLYAQGMTVAAMQALILGRQVAAGIPQPTAFFRGISACIDSPWDFSAGADLGYPGVAGRRTVKTNLVNAYVSRLQRVAVHDGVLANAFIRTAGLVDPPQRLLRPAHVIRVLRQSRRSAGALADPPRPVSVPRP